MKYYYYSTVDDIVLNHSNIIEKNYLETITLHYERSNAPLIWELAKEYAEYEIEQSS